SSDVCSSDLTRRIRRVPPRGTSIDAAITFCSQMSCVAGFVIWTAPHPTTANSSSGSSEKRLPSRLHTDDPEEPGVPARTKRLPGATSAVLLLRTRPLPWTSYHPASGTWTPLPPTSAKPPALRSSVSVHTSLSDNPDPPIVYCAMRGAAKASTYAFVAACAARVGVGAVRD